MKASLHIVMKFKLSLNLTLTSLKTVMIGGRQVGVSLETKPSNVNSVTRVSAVHIFSKDTSMSTLEKNLSTVIIVTRVSVSQVP